MLPPHELKKKNFTKAVRGYAANEVDEHIDFIIEKYTELYRQNDELERKLRTALAQIDAYKTEEESIRSALINAQKAGTKIVAEANERADAIARSAKANCDRMIAELRNKVAKERDTLYRLQRMAADFKTHVFEEYQKHIEQLENLAPELDENGEWNASDEKYVRRVISAIKDDAAAGGSGEDETYEKLETPDSEASDENVSDNNVGLIAENADTVEEEQEGVGEQYEYLEEEADFAEEEPITDEELDAETGVFNGDVDYGEPDEAQESGEADEADGYYYDEAGQAYEDGSLPDYDLDNTADTIELERVPAADDGKYRSAGVKDTIRALNRKFSDKEGESEDTQKKNDSEAIDDEADREFLKMIQNATRDAQKRQDQKQQGGMRKKRSQPFSVTDEFNIVYGENNKNKK